MTKRVITVNFDTPISAVAELLFDGNLTGVPVVDEQNYVIGIVTEYDLVSKHEHLHIPTYTKLLTQLRASKNDTNTKRQIESVQALQVGDIMTRSVVTLREDEDISRAADIFSEQRINPLPVLNSEQKLVGIVSRADLVKLLKHQENINKY